MNMRLLMVYKIATTKRFDKDFARLSQRVVLINCVSDKKLAVIDCFSDKT